MKNLINKRYAEVQAVVGSLDEVDALMQEVTLRMEELKRENLSLHYAKQALTKGFAVGDIVANDEYPVRYSVTAYTNGMFMGTPMSGRGTKQIGLYGGWRRVFK